MVTIIFQCVPGCNPGEVIIRSLGAERSSATLSIRVIEPVLQRAFALVESTGRSRCRQRVSHGSHLLCAMRRLSRFSVPGHWVSEHERRIQRRSQSSSPSLLRTLLTQSQPPTNLPLSSNHNMSTLSFLLVCEPAPKPLPLLVSSLTTSQLGSVYNSLTHHTFLWLSSTAHSRHRARSSGTRLVRRAQ